MFKNMKIGMRLGLGFGIIIFLLIAMGTFSITQMNRIADDIDKVANDMFPKTVICNTIVNEINIVARAIRNMALLNDVSKIDTEEKRIDEAVKIVGEEFKKLESTITSTEGKKLLSTAMSAEENYLPTQIEIRKLIHENKKDQAVAILLSKFRDLQNSYIKAVDELITYQSDLTSQYGKEGHSAAQSGQMTTIILCIVILLIGIIAAIFITKTITNPITKCIEIADKVASGNTDINIETDSKDETGQLMGALSKMVESIRRLVSDTGMLSKAAIDGKLDTRTDATKHQGDYRKIIEGVNGTLDAVVGPLNVAAEYVDRISKGDMPQKITDNYNGDFNEIKNNLNQCIGAINLLISDTNTLAKAAINGKLTERADGSKHQGDFGKIIIGVNNTIDRLVGLLDNMPTPLMIIDSEFTIQYMNKAGATAGGRQQKELIGTKCFDFFKTNDCRTDKCACGVAMRNGMAASSETSANPGNLKLEIAYNGVPLKDMNGNIIGAFEVVTDQTQIKKAMQVAAKVADYQQVEVKKVTDCLSKLSKGDLQFKAETNSADSDTVNTKKDFDTICTAINDCKNAVNNLISDTDKLSEAAIKGKLETRADATKHQGDFRKVVEGINSTLDSVIGPLNVAAKYVDDISRGVIPPLITDNYNGDFNLIKNNLNSVVKMMGDLLSETDKLVKAAINGQLETRANATLFVGGWNQLVSGVNQTLESVLGPINEAAAVLEKVAGRDMTARVVGDYKGDLAKIKNALNTAVENLDKALQQVTEATEQVSSASIQISSGSQSLAQGANEQASSLEEVSSSLEEMSSMTKQNADNANQAKGLSGEADGNAKAGTEAMSRMSGAINRIKESSDQTAKIVKTIDEIAMQTNLLALNAAVEAARAGEAGRGFAVVAEEVRNLAQRSAQAAKNTADMITESVKNADDGVKIAVEVSQSFETIATSAKKVNDLIAEIAAASQEQSSGIEQINTAVAQMDKVTQQNAANSEESASAAEQLSSQSEELKSMIAQFELSYSGSSSVTTNMSRTSISHSPMQTQVHGRTAPRAIGKKGGGKTMTIKPNDIIPMDEAALKEF